MRSKLVSWNEHCFSSSSCSINGGSWTTVGGLPVTQRSQFPKGLGWGCQGAAAAVGAAPGLEWEKQNNPWGNTIKTRKL